MQMDVNVTDGQKLAWSLADISNRTGLCINFLRYEIRRGNLKRKKFGSRILVLNGELMRYLETGSEGAKAGK